MILTIILSVIVFGLIIFFFYIDYQLNNNTLMYKVVDESCYYCIYSTKPHSIRDENKNTCKITNKKKT